MKHPVRHRSPADPVAAHELYLWAMNDSAFYHRHFKPAVENLRKKAKRGVFDAAKALVLMRYVADAAAKGYIHEFGTANDMGVVFNPATRDIAAGAFLNRATDELADEGVRVANPRRKRARKTNPSRRMTMADVRLKNRLFHEREGTQDAYYFSAGNRRFFGPEKFYGPYTGSGGVYFVQSNKAGVSVKQVEPSGHIRYGVGRFPSVALAREAAQRAAKGLL